MLQSPSAATASLQTFMTGSCRVIGIVMFLGACAAFEVAEAAFFVIGRFFSNSLFAVRSGARPA